MLEHRAYPRHPSPWPARVWLTDEHVLVGRAVDVGAHEMYLVRSKLAPTDTVGLSETYRVEVKPEPHARVVLHRCGPLPAWRRR